MPESVLDPVWEFFHRFKANTYWVAAIMVANILGIVFGYYYYWDVGQFAPGSEYFRAYGWWPFIPDSPNAVVLMSAALILYQFGGRRSRILDALAFTSMVYVGLWTTMLFLTFPDQLGTWDWGGTNNILFFSHLGMPLEALLLVRDMKEGRPGGLFVAGILSWHALSMYLDYGPVHLHPAPFLVDHSDLHRYSFVIMAFTLVAWTLVMWPQMARRRQRPVAAG